MSGGSAATVFKGEGVGDLSHNKDGDDFPFDEIFQPLKARSGRHPHEWRNGNIKPTTSKFREVIMSALSKISDFESDCAFVAVKTPALIEGFSLRVSRVTYAISISPEFYFDLTQIGQYAYQMGIRAVVGKNHSFLAKIFTLLMGVHNHLESCKVCDSTKCGGGPNDGKKVYGFHLFRDYASLLMHDAAINMGMRAADFYPEVKLDASKTLFVSGEEGVNFARVVVCLRDKCPELFARHEVPPVIVTSDAGAVSDDGVRWTFWRNFLGMLNGKHDDAPEDSAALSLLSAPERLAISHYGSRSSWRRPDGVEVRIHFSCRRELRMYTLEQGADGDDLIVTLTEGETLEKVKVKVGKKESWCGRCECRETCMIAECLNLASRSQDGIENMSCLFVVSS